MDKEHESLPPHRGSAPSQRRHLSCLKDPPPLARENAPRANLTRNGRLTGRPTRARDRRQSPFFLSRLRPLQTTQTRDEQPCQLSGLVSPRVGLRRGWAGARPGGVPAPRPWYQGILSTIPTPQIGDKRKVLPSQFSMTPTGNALLRHLNRHENRPAHPNAHHVGNTPERDSKSTASRKRECARL